MSERLQRTLKLLRKGDLAAAEREARALRLAPGDAVALVNEGMAWKGLRRPAEAKHAFELAGPHPMARFNLGYILMLENDLERGPRTRCSWCPSRVSAISCS